MSSAKVQKSLHFLVILDNLVLVFGFWVGLGERGEGCWCLVKGLYLEQWQQPNIIKMNESYELILYFIVTL